VLRGASWNNDDSRNLLSSNRNNNTPDNRNDNNGFRCVLVCGSAARWPRHQESARCRTGKRPVRPEPRSHLTFPATPRRSRGKDAAQAVTGKPMRGLKATACFSRQC